MDRLASWLSFSSGALFFFQRLVQERCRLAVAELLGECAEGAVKGDLVVLGFLGRGDEAGVFGVLVETEIHDLLAFRDDPFHRLAGVGAGLASDLLANLFQAFDLPFSSLCSSNRARRSAEVAALAILGRALVSCVSAL